MGKNAVKATGAQGRRDVLMVDPESVILIKDKKHPLYDPRVHLPLDEGTVLNMMQHGVIEPVIVRRNGEKDGGVAILEVVAGRQRTKNLIEANRRLKEQGKETWSLPVILRRGDDADLIGVRISENEIRRDVNPFAKAKDMANLAQMGKDEDWIARQYGYTPQTVKHHLALLDCAPSVQTAVEEGRITATLAALELSKLPREEQEPTLVKLLAETGGVARGAEAKERVRRLTARNGDGTAKKPVKKLRKPKEITKAIKTLLKLERQDATIAVAMLKWVQGSENSLTKFKALEEALLPEEATT